MCKVGVGAGYVKSFVGSIRDGAGRGGTWEDMGET